MELESFANDFFDKFIQSIEKNYGSKLEESYNILLGFGITIIVEILK